MPTGSMAVGCRISVKVEGAELGRSDYRQMFEEVSIRTARSKKDSRVLGK